VTDLNKIKRVYFLGIGGIGMSALARYFKKGGKMVAGYDRTATDLTIQLEKEGIPIHYTDNSDLIPGPFRSQNNSLIIYTPALPADHAELAFFRTQGFTVYKRSEILGLLTRTKKTIAVAGTHGKTTVSTMIAHLMTNAGPGCSAFLGGISLNFGSNLVMDTNSEWVVVEADEFDRSFLRLFPHAAIITAMDPDHLDIYGDYAEMESAFSRFAEQINKEGILLMKNGLPVRPSVMPHNTSTYSLHGPGDFYATNISLHNRKYHFDLIGPEVIVHDISLIHPGMVNVENAVAACALCTLLGLDKERIRNAMENFSGIRRRFEYRILTDSMVFIDDYAHHPKEIEATLLSLRELYPGRKLTGIFQPHLYTRTRDFAEGFAESLGLLDELILLDIYPAREMPIEGVNSEMILRKVKLKEKMICSRGQLLDKLQDRIPEVLITLGAGDIDKLVEPIEKIFSAKLNL